MLPDLSNLKSDLSARLHRFLEIRLRKHLGPLRDSPRITFFEGHERIMVRESGQEEAVQPFDLNATLTFANDELPTLMLKDLFERLDDAAKDMAGQMATRAYETISEAAKKVGNLVDARQKTVSAQMILESLSKMHIDFDRRGFPRMPSIHCHPQLEKAIRLASEELERDPILRAELKQLLTLKKEEWRVREASRRLVG